MPPATPSRTRGRVPSTSPRPGRRARALLGALGVLEEAGLDLAHGDRQRLLARARLDERADVLEQALAELRVVVVDLPGPLGGVDHQRVLRRDLVEQVVDRRVGDALGKRARGGAGQRHAHSGTPVIGGAPAGTAALFRGAAAPEPGPTINSTNVATTACRSSFTTTTSNS